MTKRHFATNDFYDSIQLLGIGLCDFDETYPHVTKQIEAWAEKWKPSVYSERVKTMDNTLKVSAPDDIYEYIIQFEMFRLDLLPYIEILINLKSPRTLDEVIATINHLMTPDKYFITYV